MIEFGKFSRSPGFRTPQTDHSSTLVPFFTSFTIGVRVPALSLAFSQRDMAASASVCPGPSQHWVGWILK
eukprot:scaffold266809_cov18-Tisochrysis_lutea.AAC.1